jgi:hypothetical protein
MGADAGEGGAASDGGGDAAVVEVDAGDASVVADVHDDVMHTAISSAPVALRSTEPKLSPVTVSELPPRPPRSMSAWSDVSGAVLVRRVDHEFLLQVGPGDVALRLQLRGLKLRFGMGGIPGGNGVNALV